MRITNPPRLGLGGLAGLCIALAALGGCAASEAGSPIAGSAAPMTTHGLDTPDAPGEPVPTRTADADDVGAAGGVDASRAPTGPLVGGADLSVVEQRPRSEASGASSDALEGDAAGAGQPADVATGTPNTATATVTTIGSTAPRSATSAVTSTPTSTTSPGRGNRHSRPGAPGTTTVPGRRPSSPTSVPPTTTTAPSANPSPSAGPPTAEPPPGAPPPTTSPPAGEPSSVSTSDAIALVNAERVAAGLAPLVEVTSLHAAAQAHSLDQATMQTMTHTGSDGSDAGDRITRAGFPAAAWGENLAAGYGSADAVIDGWMSPDGDDRANILDPAFTAVGVASAEAGDGTVYWTMVLAG